MTVGFWARAGPANFDGLKWEQVEKTFVSWIAVSVIVWPLLAQTTQPKALPAHPHTATKAKSTATKAKSSAKAPIAHRTSVRSASTKSKAATKSKTVRRPVRSYQQAPTPERYQEIQQALAKKGYFQGEANGQWGPDSLDALKRFQAEQNLTPTGKINSMSLIALGLGPKRLTAQSKPAATPAPAPAPQ